MEITMKPVRVPLSFPIKWLERQAFVIPAVSILLLIISMLLPIPEKTVIVLGVVYLAMIYGLLALPFVCDCVLFPEGVQLRIVGKVVRQIPISEFKLLCAVGDDRSYNLCLCGMNLEELAMQREIILQKGYFSRQDLPFRKRRPGWKERFAREYLLNPKGRSSQRALLLWLPFDPVLAIYLRRIYPQLPCVDVAEKISWKYSMEPKDQIPYYLEYYRADGKGVHILKGNKRIELRCIPAESIQTIFRVDRFSVKKTGDPSISSYLVISQRTVKELAQRGKAKQWQKWKRAIIDQLPEAEEMYATEFHFAGLFTWNWKTATDCHIKYTPGAEAQLRQLYPHAQWVDHFGKWM